MIAIADSGTTKTSWLFVDKNGNNYTYKTVGLNPYYQSSEDIYSNLKDGLKPNLEFSEKIDRIFLYGAGCEAPEKREEVAKGIRKAFPESTVTVDHDLLAAARALFWDEAGIACIAGTGANSCYYDGKDIKKNVHSLGLFLGDEGSGGYLGKLLVSDYIREAMPERIRTKFEAKFEDRQNDILDHVYTKAFPSRYLASFVPFLVENKYDEYIHNMVIRSFDDQFVNCVLRYEKVKEIQVGFIGSVAFYLQDELKQVAKNHGVNITKIIRNPLEELAAYHQSKGIY